MNKLIGRGGQALEVKLVDWKGQPAVMKVMRDGWRGHVNHEFKILKQLEVSPRFPKPLHLDKAAGYYIMEYLDAEMIWRLEPKDLRDFLDDEDYFSGQIWDIYFEANSKGVILDASHGSHIMWSVEKKFLYRIDVGQARFGSFPENEVVSHYYANIEEQMKIFREYLYHREDTFPNKTWMDCCQSCQRKADPFGVYTGIDWITGGK